MKLDDIKVGMRIMWNDPDEGECSGTGKVTKITSEDSIVVYLDKGGIVEALIDELEPVKSNRKGSCGKYYLVLQEWNYPTETGREFVDDFDTLNAAIECCEEECENEIANFCEAVGDCLNPERIAGENAFVLSSKMGLDDFYFIARVIEVIPQVDVECAKGHCESINLFDSFVEKFKEVAKSERMDSVETALFVRNATDAFNRLLCKG